MTTSIPAEAGSSGGSSDLRPGWAVPDEIDALAVLGHSHVTGYNSDPDLPFRNAFENSWATGINPEVNSVYLRLLADHPELAGHGYNLARNGAPASELVRQAAEAVHLTPGPDLFLLLAVDNDIRCDGTDDANLEAFGEAISEALDVIEQGAPEARTFVVSSPAMSVQTLVDTLGHLEEVREAYSGNSPCALFGADGAVRSEGVQYLQSVVDGYHRVLAEQCGARPTCRYDGGAGARLALRTEHVSPDRNHFTVAGHNAIATLVWNAMHSPDQRSTP